MPSPQGHLCSSVLCQLPSCQFNQKMYDNHGDEDDEEEDGGGDRDRDDDDDDACQAFQSHNPLTARATIGATFAVLRLRLHLV
jgi:hypothetical protein